MYFPRMGSILRVPPWLLFGDKDKITISHPNPSTNLANLPLEPS